MSALVFSTFGGDLQPPVEQTESTIYEYVYVRNGPGDTIDPNGLIGLACTPTQVLACIIGCQGKGLTFDKCVQGLGYVPPNPQPVPGFRCYCKRPKTCLYQCGDIVMPKPPPGNGKSCPQCAMIDGQMCNLVGSF